MCRHRGGRLCAEDEGQARRGLRCGYHAWTYDLDGRLVATPNLVAMPDVDRVAYGLIRVGLREWLGYAWVRVLVEPVITGGIETSSASCKNRCSARSSSSGSAASPPECSVTTWPAWPRSPTPVPRADPLDRAAPVLLGHGGQPAADLQALRDMLLRVSRLTDDLPQVVELSLNRVIARPDGVIAVNARLRVTSHHLADPFLGQLPPRHMTPAEPGRTLTAEPRP